jgi:beta-1,4-mannooligosaccharide/beta-1,4-mannosyl-N-acetylglucosamine phosphorylase
MGTAADCVTRHPSNPIVSIDRVPYPTKMVYNAGAARTDVDYVMLLRVDLPDGTKRLGLARSPDGVEFTVHPEPVFSADENENNCVYDSRITRIGDEYYVTYATDTPAGIRSGLAVTRDFLDYERIYLSEPDNRNAVIFPRKIGEWYVRLDRPFARVYEATRPYDIWLSESPDLEFWGRHRLVLEAKDVAWGRHKIGPGAPPIETHEGWLCIFHGAELREPDHTGWHKDYHAGVMLLDLEEPWRIRGRCLEPIISPEAPYELLGYRPRVIFPTGTVAEPDGAVKIYYGAADQVMCLATAGLADLVDLCLNA